MFDYKKLLNLKKRRFLGYRDLSKLTGIGKNTLNDLALWRIFEPNSKTIDKLCNYFKVDRKFWFIEEPFQHKLFK